VPLSGWLPGMLLAGLMLAAQIDLDCSKPRQARAWLDRLMLAEIEGAEDTHRAAMWDAFGRCPAGTGGTPCRIKVRKRFEAEWELQKQGIEGRYQQVLSDFEERCRASLALQPAPVARRRPAVRVERRPRPTRDEG
jgi:hypothetical protein